MGRQICGCRRAAESRRKVDDLKRRARRVVDATRAATGEEVPGLDGSEKGRDTKPPAVTDNQDTLERSMRRVGRAATMCCGGDRTDRWSGTTSRRAGMVRGCMLSMWLTQLTGRRTPLKAFRSGDGSAGSEAERRWK